MPSDQFTIEFTHLLPAVSTAVSTSHQNGFRARFHSVQGLNAAAIEYPSVVQFGHDTQQCIEAADLFWEFLRSPVTHGGKPELNDVREATRRLPARKANCIRLFFSSRHAVHERIACCCSSSYSIWAFL